MKNNLIASIEALLFVNGESLSFQSLIKILGVKQDVLMSTLDKLEQNLLQENRGLALVRDQKSVRLAVKSDLSVVVESLAKSELQADLSKAALEVLSIVAYLSPIARAEIDSIRGVNSSFTLRNLALRGLVERQGNPNDARGYVYEPSMNFLVTLGLSKVNDLPNYETLRVDQRLQALLGRMENEVEEKVHEEA